MTSDTSTPTVPVEIVVATYNGERYLPAWLDSIAGQSWPAVSIVATDDGSADGTVAVLRGETRTPIALAVMQENRGVRHSFEDALSRARAEYVFLADQDDRWHPDKIATMMARLLEAEHRLGRDHPILVSCDLRIVDRDLGVIQPSFFGSTSKDPNAARLQDFIISNHVPGCAVAFNRALLDLVLPMPAGTYIHDWWIMLVAASKGTILHVDAAMIDWRQHGGNTLGYSGARRSRTRQILHYANRLFTRPGERLRDYRRQATVVRSNILALRSAFGDRLSPPVASLLDQLDQPRWRDRRAALANARTGESGLATWIITWLLGPRHNSSD